MRKSPLQAAATALVLGLAAASPALAAPASGAFAPCESPAWPAPALAGSPPTIATWTLTQLPPGWLFQPCVGWDRQRFSSYAAVVGTFQATGMDALLNRIGAISTFKGLRYWSVTDRRLQTLITEASAVEGPGISDGRGDFTPPDIQVGRDLFFTEHDNRSSEPVLYRMRVVETSPDRLVVDIANETSVRLFLFTLFDPGNVHTAFFISRTAEGTWVCYALLAYHPTALAGLMDNHKSHINRLVALYGHIAGSGDSELPWVK